MQLASHPDSAGGAPATSWPVSLWWIVLAGLVLRIVWALVIPMHPVSDSHAYHTFATNIAEHGVYGWTPEEPGAFWPVGTSAIVAGLYMLFGPGFGPVVVLNIVVSVLVIAQVFWLGRQYFGTAVGLAAAAIIAFWPSLIMYVTIIASEVIFLFLLLGGLIAFESRARSVWVGVLLAGLFWSAALYVRPVALLVPLVFGASALLRGADGLGRTLLRVGAIYVMIFAAVAPWSARNVALFGEQVMVSTNFGPVFWMGNNPDTTGGFQILPDWTQGLSETERAARLKSEAFAYVAAEPGAFVLRTVRKFVGMHARETVAVAWNAREIVALVGNTGPSVLKLIASGFWLAVVLAALAGLWQLWRWQGAWQMLVHPAFLGWVYFTWVHAVIIEGDRYHFPAIPFVTVLAALGLKALLRRGRGAQ